MDIKQYIPKDKHDFDSINRIKLLSDEDIKPIIPDLLKWLQDSNWPIAREVMKILHRFDGELTPYIKEILCSSDAGWKYYILADFVSELPKERIAELKPELLDLALHPNNLDQSVEVDKEAIAILELIGEL